MISKTELFTIQKSVVLSLYIINFTLIIRNQAYAFYANFIHNQNRVALKKRSKCGKANKCEARASGARCLTHTAGVQ